MSGREECLPSVRRVVRAMGHAYQISNDIQNAGGGNGGEVAFKDLKTRAPNAVLVSFHRSKLIG